MANIWGSFILRNPICFCLICHAPISSFVNNLLERQTVRFVALFVLGFNVSVTLFQTYCDGTCMRQVRVLPHWNVPVAGTWQEYCAFCQYSINRLSHKKLPWKCEKNIVQMILPNKRTTSKEKVKKRERGYKIIFKCKTWITHKSMIRI